MVNSTGKLITSLLGALVIITLTASCLGPAPKVVDIVGIHELKPLQEITLTCAGEDENTSVVYTWSAEKGTIKGDGRQVNWTAPDLPGDYTITVKVKNPQGRETAFSKSFKVTDDPFHNDTPDNTIYLKLSPPSDILVSVTRQAKSWTTSEIECIVPGMAESDLSYKWTALTGRLVANGLADGKAKRVGWTAPGVASLNKVSVTVTDKSGNTASGEVNFDVYCCRP